MTPWWRRSLPSYRPKSGRLSKTDANYIKRYRHSKTSEEIGLKLGRAVHQVDAYIKEHFNDVVVPGKTLTRGSELEGRPEWANLTKQYTADELDYFKYQYLNLINQFGKDDVLPTEEMQIFQVIAFDIMMGRTMSEQKEAQDRIAQIARDLATSKADVRKVKLEDEYRDCQKVLKECHARHGTMVVQQSKILTDLKATREQRVKVVEGSRQSFIGLLKRLMADEEFRLKAGYEAGAMHLAMQRETARLTAPYKFDDGVVDQVLLSASTLHDEFPPAPFPAGGEFDPDGPITGKGRGETTS